MVQSLGWGSCKLYKGLGSRGKGREDKGSPPPNKLGTAKPALCRLGLGVRG